MLTHSVPSGSGTSAVMVCTSDQLSRSQMTRSSASPVGSGAPVTAHELNRIVHRPSTDSVRAVKIRRLVA